MSTPQSDFTTSWKRPTIASLAVYVQFATLTSPSVFSAATISSLDISLFRMDTCILAPPATTGATWVATAATTGAACVATAATVGATCVAAAATVGAACLAAAATVGSACVAAAAAVGADAGADAEHAA